VAYLGIKDKEMDDSTRNSVFIGVNHNQSTGSSPYSSTASGLNYFPGNGNSNGSKKRTASLSGNPDEDNILLHSFDYIRSLPGKQVRSKLSVAFNYWLKVDPEILEKICDIVELLHNASLLYV